MARTAEYKRAAPAGLHEEAVEDMGLRDRVHEVDGRGVATGGAPISAAQPKSTSDQHCERCRQRMCAGLMSRWQRPALCMWCTRSAMHASAHSFASRPGSTLSVQSCSACTRVQALQRSRVVGNRKLHVQQLAILRGRQPPVLQPRLASAFTIQALLS